ncbi:MAG: hypothetical protein AAFW67_00890 [Cyanobacteria bacterium J06638_38]
MEPEFNNLQSDWLNQAEEFNDNEAAQVNGGGSFEDAIAGMQAAFDEATQRNIELRQLTTEQGTVLNAAKKDVNPK